LSDFVLSATTSIERGNSAIAVGNNLAKTAFVYDFGSNSSIVIRRSVDILELK
jgi:hypothetical protein